MNEQEQEDFDGAKSMVNQGKFAEALTIVQNLYSKYPRNPEVQELMNICNKGYNKQVGFDPFKNIKAKPKESDYDYKETSFSAYNQSSYQSNQQINNLYFAPLAGCILMCIAVFLPWANFSLSSGFIAVGGSKDGLGNLSGSPAFTASGNSGGGDGIITLIVGILCGIICFIGLTNKYYKAWLPSLILGIVGGGIGILDYFDVTSKAKNFTDGLDANVSGSIQVGAGIVVTIIAAIVIIVGSWIINSKGNNNVQQLR